MSGPSASRLVDDLAFAVWIRRLAVEGGRRRYSVDLKARGQAWLQPPREKLAEHQRRLAAGRRKAERVQPIGLLGRLTR